MKLLKSGKMRELGSGSMLISKDKKKLLLNIKSLM